MRGNDVAQRMKVVPSAVVEQRFVSTKHVTDPYGMLRPSIIEECQQLSQDTGHRNVGQVVQDENASPTDAVGINNIVLWIIRVLLW